MHSYLGIGKDFATWVKDRIEQYDFLENQDFVCSLVLGSKGRGGHNAKDYHLTLDAGKQVTMMSEAAIDYAISINLADYAIGIICRYLREYAYLLENDQLCH